ncbi:MFS transporter [Micromonospora sp. WMMD1102]|uniref:MFS transporter n=1 Tax=Micromonospora sp. WMMD1102 TaxID=3016105 RepID=UPI002414DB15|nr:MFS transporter [Micromonospora sp. WMMD1102]MDG4787278.1 MFS transporter [Micromonospora sp. WMMD1102]
MTTAPAGSTTSDHGSSGDRAARRDRDFPLFWAGQALSAFGDAFSLLAVPLLVLEATGSVARMGLLTGLVGAASVGAGTVAGHLVDRVDRRLLLLGCDLCRAAGYASIPLGWLLGPQLWLVFLVAPACAAAGMVFQVGYVAAVPALVGPDRITRANGQLYATYAAAGVVGPVLAGLLCAAVGPTAAIAIDAGSFALAALGLCFVRLRVPAGRRARDAPADSTGRGGGADRSGWADLLVGVRFLWRHPVLRTLTLLLSVLTFLTIGLTDVFVYHVKHDLGRSDGSVGHVLAAAAGGTIVAALLVAPVRRALGFGACWIGAYALGGLAVAGVGLTRQVPVLALPVATYTFGTGLAGICSMSLRQQVTPEHLLGRVTSAFWTLHSALGPLGATVLTGAVARYGTAPVCLAAGLACLTVAAVATTTPIRAPRPELVPDRATGPRTG